MSLATVATENQPDIPPVELARAPLHYAGAYRIQRDALAELCESLISELERDPNARIPHGKRLLLFKLSQRPISPEELYAKYSGDGT